MTCLRDTRCPASVLWSGGENSGEMDIEVDIRRVVFFGGQSEGIPFDAFNDLYLLAVHLDKDAARRYAPRNALAFA